MKTKECTAKIAFTKCTQNEIAFLSTYCCDHSKTRCNHISLKNLELTTNGQTFLNFTLYLFDVSKNYQVSTLYVDCSIHIRKIIL